jgi:hypothetical protein
MTQTMNNQILLRTLAFCAVVAGIGAVPAVALDEMQQRNAAMDRAIRQRRSDLYQELEMNRMQQEMRDMRYQQWRRDYR